MKKLNLNNDQIAAYNNMEAMQKYIQAANNLLLQSLQGMMKDEESVLFQPTDIYPELWEAMVNDTIALTRNFETTLEKKIKDLIRSYVLAESKNPIVENEDERETSSSQDSIAAVPTVFKKREVEGVDPKDLFENIWKDLIKNDECGIYSNLKDANYIHNQIWDAVKKYDEAGELPRDNYMDLTNAISNVSNPFVAIDIIWNLFECPYDVKPTIALTKYGYVNDVIQREQQQKEQIDNEIVEANESTEEVVEVDDDYDEEIVSDENAN